ncbi:MAG: efflux RND transporter periplasmic adaptor subunit [Candidatus Moraniibacteriota bacterium]|jgi:multidrug efflux pump subunit AcrA (membrane-fusion protein)
MKKAKVIKIVGIIVTISLIAYGIIYFGFLKKDVPELEYTTEKVIKGNIQSSISVDGTIVFDTWNLEFLNSGIVQTIDVELGDEVKKDQVIAVLDASAESNRIAQSTADLNASVANRDRMSEDGVDYELQKKKYSASKDKADTEDDLYDEYVDQYGKESTQALSQKIKKESAEDDVKITKKQLEQVEVSYDNAQYQVDKSSSAYQQSLQAYDDYEITAPVSGAIIAQINGTEGSVILNNNNSTTEPFIVMVDPDSFWFETYVEDVEALKITPDMKAYITLDAYPNEEFEGRAIFVSPVAELDSNDLATYKVIIAVDDIEEQLLSDMFGSAELVSEEVRDVLMISSAAVTNKNGKKIVIIKTSNGFEEKEVNTGFTNGKKVEITSGLKLGEEIVIIK